jgi:hypothetical protein
MRIVKHIGSYRRIASFLEPRYNPLMLTLPPILGPTDNSLPNFVLVKGAHRCQALTTSSNCFQGQVIWNTVAVFGARQTLNLYFVYTPKLPPPPPREAHRRSLLHFLFA